MKITVAAVCDRRKSIKHRRSQTAATALFALLFSIALVLGLPARAQPFGVAAFNTTNILETGTTYVLATNNNIVNLSPARGLALWADLKPGGDTNTFVLTCHLSPDGTIWATNNAIVWTLNIATNSTWQTNVPASLLDNSRFLRAYSVSTANSNKMTNAIYWSRHF
jgi:hypothetical protein